MKEIKGVFDIFLDSEDYPQNVAERGVAEDTAYCYISNTFLNGFINYVDVIKAVVVERYTCPPDCDCINGNTDTCVVWDSPEFHERLKPMISNFHCDWSYSPDDVWILAETENCWWFFWYDRDCSDCCIGRANKQRLISDGLTKEKLIEVFDHCTKTWEGYNKGRTFDFTSHCKGWLTG